jgi:hypothetical protein
MAQSQPLSLPQVIAASGTIFSGTVMKVWSELDASAGFVVTYTTVAVRETVRGLNAKTLTFKQYGGSHNGLNVVVADMSYFAEGEEVIAFLYPASSAGLTSPVGTSEGKLTVRRDPKTGKDFVCGNFLHAKMVESFIEKATLPQTATSGSTPIMEYGRFMSFVRQLAQRNSQE